MSLDDLRKWLETLSAAHALVPASEVLDRLPVTTDGAGEDTLAALDVEAAGKALGRSSSTVREYARAGLLPGAYRQRGREWRIPQDAIRRFQQKEAQRDVATVTSSGRHGSDGDLSAWRREIDTA